MSGPYYQNNKVDELDYIEAADLESIETGFLSVDTDKANKVVPAAVSNVATLTATGDLSDSAKSLPAGDIVGTSDEQSLSSKTLLSAILNGGFTEQVFTITDGASVDINPANGSIQLWTLGATRTPTASSFASGQSVLLAVDDGTAYDIVWTTISVTWLTDAGTAPTLKTTGHTLIALVKIGSAVYGARIGNA